MNDYLMEECFNNEVNSKDCPIVESQIGFVLGMINHNTKNKKGCVPHPYACVMVRIAC